MYIVPLEMSDKDRQTEDGHCSGGNGKGDNWRYSIKTTGDIR